MQRLTRGFAIAATTFLLLGAAIPAKAVGVDYRIVQMASGTLGGKPFTNVPVSVDFFGDTASVIPKPLSTDPATGANIVASGGTVQVTVPGIGVAIVTNNAAIWSTGSPVTFLGPEPCVFVSVSDQKPPVTPLEKGGFLMALSCGNSLLNYDLRTSFPVAALPTSVGYNPVKSIPTTLGALTFAADLTVPPTNQGTLSVAVGQVTPQVGLWWNPDESGSGYALDYKHGVLVVTTYSYKTDGSAQWYLSSGLVVDNVFTASLDKYTNGQCISCSYTGRPSGPTSEGTMTITFTSPSSATVHLPGGRVFQIQPQPF